MEILECYQTENRCYQKGRKVEQVGILVHSTGAVNRNLARYVDAPERLGKNRYNNHWNSVKADKCMHAFVGCDKSKAVIVANTLPYSCACWGCGKGNKGSYNYAPTAHIQFEICQGNNTDAAYYKEAIDVAAAYCAYLCRMHEWTAENICSHREAARAGYASNHGDPDSWMRYFDDSMNQFRVRVTALLAGEPGEYEISNAGQAGDATPYATVRMGSSGACVSKLQHALIGLGYALSHGADGSFGAETFTALVQFQRDHALEADGVCGKLTWAAINAAQVDVPVLPDVPDVPDVPSKLTYTLTIPCVDAATATYLLENYKGAQAVEEKVKG